MIDLDALKQLWHEPPNAQELNPISKGELMALIQARTEDIKQATLARLRTESYNYVVLLIIPVSMLFASHGLTLRAVLTSLGVFATLCPILGALAYKEYRLRTLPLDGTLRQSLEAIVAAIDSTSRFYMATYMMCVAGGVALAEGFLAWRYGVHWIPAAALVGGVAFMFWAYRSGRAYVRRMFGAARSELMDNLDDLQRT